ncbi:hypothetical protein IFM89_021553 [Coptis chinensis]|uniref:Protein kinase domain-containing protein n=1 Tax=Coptis chinensis TaxID=261450 RepID=A0A835ID74_9MAGN|nr:hypothetical protein IFM89_021553 [Coptis chinensis]
MVYCNISNSSFSYKKKMVQPTPAKILVNISLDVELNNELLSWAIGAAARPNDTIVALHILGKDSSRKLESTTYSKTSLRQAKAFVISMVGEFYETCQSKQVNLEARVSSGSSIGRGLIDEAISIGASYLVVGGLRKRNQSQRSSLGIMKYCFEHAPDYCSVVTVGISRQSQQHLDSECSPLEASSCQISSIRPNKDARVGNDIPLYKFFDSNIREEQSFRKKKNQQRSPTQSSNDKPSPRAVLDGPHGIEEGYLSHEESSIAESPKMQLKEQGRSNIWKHLSPMRLLFPFRSTFDGRVRDRSQSFSDKENRQPSWSCFSYEEISNATNHFHQAIAFADNIVGRGGYAVVYRGDLCDGRTIAVKRLAKDNTDENKQKEFLMELGVLGHVCHPNTACLIGCCFENGLHLIFEFSPNGNLSSALHGKDCNMLEWPVRYKIVIGIARGLHYLHKCCKRRIIHRDIKASNVLLGPDFEPQITDFGLAKWLPKQWTHHSVIPIEGTFGYLAPEYFMHGIVDEKTDVFAFGVLLLEIITGRRPIDMSKQSLMFWAKPLIESVNIEALADSKLESNYDVDEMRRLVLTASYCIRQSSLWRPSMNEVLQLLTNGNDSEIAQNWRMHECKVDEIDDYTVDFDSRSSTNQIFQDC